MCSIIQLLIIELIKHNVPIVKNNQDHLSEDL